MALFILSGGAIIASVDMQKAVRMHSLTVLLLLTWRSNFRAKILLPTDLRPESSL